MTDTTLDTTAARPAVRLERYLPDPPPVVWMNISSKQIQGRGFGVGIATQDSKQFR